nr:PIG-L deacetylase family protein [Sphingomonas arenae]
MRRVVVVAPHPDDEVLGCGGTIARLADEGVDVHVVIVTRGEPPAFDAAFVVQVRREAAEAHRRLGVGQSHFVDLPAARLDTVGQAEVNARLAAVLDKIGPDTLFLPFFGDIHRDHQVAFTAAMVWARPRNAQAPSTVLAYETLSETNWYAPPATPAFIPTFYVDISPYLDAKLEAFGCYESQVKRFPDERSPEAIRALAQSRGATVYRAAAEAFVHVRGVL